MRHDYFNFPHLYIILHGGGGVQRSHFIKFITDMNRIQLLLLLLLKTGKAIRFGLNRRTTYYLIKHLRFVLYCDGIRYRLSTTLTMKLNNSGIDTATIYISL